MLTQMIHLTLTLVLTSLLSYAAGAETRTGKQCIDHLKPITAWAVDHSLASKFYKINDEIPNVLGRPLTEIIETSRESGKEFSSLAQYFIFQAHHTMTKCASDCPGIRDRRGNSVNCAEMSILDIYQKINLIDENAIAESDFEPDPECAFNPHTEKCNPVVQVPQEESPSDPVIQDEDQNSDDLADITPVEIDTGKVRDSGHYFKYWTRPAVSSNQRVSF